MAARKTTDLTALTAPTANTLVAAVDLTEALPSNQNKKLTLSDLTKGLSAATTGAAGVVQLSTSTSSTSTTLAATPSAVKSAYDAATTPATTSAAGIVQLSTSTSSTSTTLAATPSAVKVAYDLAAAAGRIIQETAKASTSGTAVDFTGIPSWAKRITIVLNGVSTNGTAQPTIQLGTSGGVQSTGYSANTTSITTGANLTTNYTNGWQLYSSLAANIISGTLTLVQQDPSTGTWVGTGLFSVNIPSVVITSGTKTLSGTLDRVRLTTANGTDTFDAGSVNILYEG